MATPFRARFGDIELVVVSASSDGGRDWTSHSPTRGDDHVMQDRGKRLRKTQCELLFCDEPGAIGDYIERAAAFRDLVTAGAPQLFRHPLHGSYPAVVEDFQEQLNAGAGVIEVSCVFVALQEPEPVFRVGAGVAPSAGPEEVGVTVDQANTQLAAAGLSSLLPSQALATVEGWANAADPDSRAILLELGSITSEIDAAIATLDLLSNFERWDLYKSFVGLRYQLTRAAETVTADTAQVLDYAVRAAVPLLALASLIYGAGAAVERAEQIRKLNGIKRPGMIKAGTVLKVPSTTEAGR